MPSNISVVVNYEEHTIFPTGQPTGYVQFTKSGDLVYLVVDGKPVGIMPASEFDSVARLVTPF